MTVGPAGPCLLAVTLSILEYLIRIDKFDNWKNPYLTVIRKGQLEAPPDLISKAKAILRACHIPGGI